MNLNTSGNIEHSAAVASELSESALAAQEFASLISKARSQSGDSSPGTNYEVHPCKRVRGYMLRLPVIGWTLWYPTASAAVDFAEKLAEIHRADCYVYDAAGSLHPRWASMEVSAAN